MAIIRDAVIQSRDLTLFQKSYADAPDVPEDDDVVTALATSAATLSGYTKRQATDGGIGFSTQQDRTPVYIDQRADRLYSIEGARTAQITAQLAELTPANMQLATGMGEVSTLAASSSAYGHERLTVGPPTDPEYNTYLSAAKQPFSRLPFTIFVPCGQSEGTLNLAVSPTQKGIAALVATALLDETYAEEDFPGGLLFITNRTTPMTA